MPRSRKPKELGLEINVIQPGSVETAGGWANLYPPDEVDSEGHHIYYEMAPMKGQQLLSLELRQGLSPGAAANMLRKIANLLERHGAKLLNIPRGGEGYFDNHGEPQEDPQQLARDEKGELEPPEIL